MTVYSMQDTANDQSGDHTCETGLLNNKRPRRQLLKGVCTSFSPQLKSSVGIRAFLQELHNRLYKYLHRHRRTCAVGFFKLKGSR